MRIGLPVGKPWPLDQMMASMMMVSANDAAYAIAEHASAAASTASPPTSNATAHATRPARQHARRSRRPRRRDVVQGRPDHERVRPRDRDPQRADGARDREVGGDARTTTFTDPTGVAAPPREPQQDAAGRRRRLPGRDRLQDRVHEPVAAHARRDRDPQRPHAASRSVLGVPDSGYREAASLLDAGFATPPDATGPARRCPPGRGLAVRDPRRRPGRVRGRRSRATRTWPSPDDRAGRSDRAAPRATRRHARRRRRAATTATGTVAASTLAGLLRAVRNLVVVFLLIAAIAIVAAPPRGEAPARDAARAPARSASARCAAAAYRSSTAATARATARPRSSRPYAWRAPTSISPSWSGPSSTAAARPTTASSRRLRSPRYQGIETPPLGRSI